MDIDDADLTYEIAVQRDPYSLKAWWSYLSSPRASSSPFHHRSILYERALRFVPGSYKLWHAYLTESLAAAKPFPITHPCCASLKATFERALGTMHRMPRIWIMYLTSLTDQRLLMKARHTFDSALRALPITQHDRIWSLFLNLISLPGVPHETSSQIHCRYLAFDPSHVEDFIEFLLQSSKWQEAAHNLASILKDDAFSSVKGKTRHELWLELCDLLVKHAADISGLNADTIILAGIREFSEEVGCLWTSLAEYYIRKGLHGKARDIFEEGINTVLTARDFGIIFDAYLEFEQTAIEAKLEAPEDSSEDVLKKQAAEKNLSLLQSCWLNDRDDTDLAMARLEKLIEQRPALLNGVLLRQNPHSVQQWHRRVKLFEVDLARQLSTYVEAIKTVDPAKAVGKPHTLYIALAKMYEEHNMLDSAHEIFMRGTQVSYIAVEHLAIVWCEWVEMELRHKNFAKAVELVQMATKEPSLSEVKHRAAAEGNEPPVQMKLHRSLRLWSL